MERYTVKAPGQDLTGDLNDDDTERSMATCKGSSTCSFLASDGGAREGLVPCSGTSSVSADSRRCSGSSSSSGRGAVPERDRGISKRGEDHRHGLREAIEAPSTLSVPPPAEADAEDSRDDSENNAEGEEGVGPMAPTAVGLINEGCTCYLNSLLQLLFHLSYFRSAVYRISLDDDDGPTVYKALQETFFQMQERTTPARTTVLTNAFGWGRRELHVQHDIQEMATLLRNNLEERMKGTVTEGAITQLFEGCGEQFVETLDKSYVSRRADTFYDVHIPLDQHTTLMESLTSLTARDQLIGDNKYRVEREGEPVVYMDAEKGYSFTRFPPVTWFHLKRFAIDLTSPTLEMRKVNSPLEFPVVLDLRSLESPNTAASTAASPVEGEEAEEMKEKEKEAEAAAARPKIGSAVVPFASDSPAIYDLQGVIVHRGTVRSGHYYCYIREWDPVRQRFCRWLEYDDENVREVSEDVAVRVNYGRSSQALDSFRHDGALLGGASAYILSYVRRADAAAILAPSPTDIVADRVKEAMRRSIQEEERQLREAEEARASAVLCCVTDASLRRYCETVCSTELFTSDPQLWRRYAECTVTVRKSDALVTVYKAVAAQPEMARGSITAENIRLWRCIDTTALRPSRAFPTYAECLKPRRLGGAGTSEDEPVSLRDFLSLEEGSIALVLCVYVEQAKPVLPGLCGVSSEHGLIHCVRADPGGRFDIVEFTNPIDAKALHIRFAPSDYTPTVEYVVSSETMNTPVAVAPILGGETTAIIPLGEVSGVVSVTVRCCTPTRRRLAVRNVHVELPLLHPLLCSPSASPKAPANATDSALPAPDAGVAAAAAAATQPVLPVVGHDRALIFFKYYDYAAMTVRFVGSRLIDKAAKVYCFAAVYRDFIGMAGEAAGVPSSPARPPQSVFRYFAERVDHTPVELDELCDLAECKMGIVVVAQLRAVPPQQRSLSVINYYHDALHSVDVRLFEVVCSHRPNDEAYRQAALERQRAAIATTAVAIAAAASTTSSTLTQSGTQSSARSGQGAAEAAEGEFVAPVGCAEVSSLHDSVKSLTFMSSSSGGLTGVNRSTSAALESVADRSIVDPVRVAMALNPYEAVQLLTLHEVRVDVLPTEYNCRMLSSWNYESVCAEIGRVIGHDPGHLQLYENSGGAGEAVPEASPTLFSHRLTVADLLHLDSCDANTVLFYEKMAVSREAQASTRVATVTLRDHAGHALHRESFHINATALTCQALVRLVCKAVPMWQREADPWGSMQETLQSRHFTLCYVDTVRHMIFSICEVPMVPAAATGVEDEEAGTALDASALCNFEVEIQAAPPLHGTEQRIACCHMHHALHDRNRTSAVAQHPCGFGQPFLITVDRTTSVQDALLIMLRCTHLPMEMVNNAERCGVMMLAGQVYHFENWHEHVHLFWLHTKNSSPYVPHLVLNHAKPREKPGSRYVAQPNPQLKISSK